MKKVLLLLFAALLVNVTYGQIGRSALFNAVTNVAVKGAEYAMERDAQRKAAELDSLKKVAEIDSLKKVAELFKIKYSLTKNKAGYFYKGMPVQDLNKHPYEKITKDEHPADGYFIFEVFENGEKLLELISWYGKEVDEIIVMSSKFKSEDGLCVGMTYEQAKKLGVQTPAANAADESLLSGSVYFQILTYSETMLFVLEHLKYDESLCPEGCPYLLPVPANTVIEKIHL